MGKMRIHGGRLIDPAGGRDGFFDVIIEDGRIKAVGLPGDFGTPEENEIVVDATGLWVMPGFVDLHVHLREPGQEYKETIETGLKASAAGGFAAVCCMPNTLPPNDNPQITQFLIRKSKETGGTKLYPVASITIRREGEILTDMEALKREGAVALSDDGDCIQSSKVMKLAMERARRVDLPIFEHAEDRLLTEGGMSHQEAGYEERGDKKWDGEEIKGGMPAEAEEIIVHRDIAIARLTGARLHFCHVSSMRSVEAIRRAKDEGLSITAEVTPHHLLLTEEAILKAGANAKVNPPLRTEKHRQALIEGIRNGTIDAIATDHAPHSKKDKEKEFRNAPFGISGIETAVSLALLLVKDGVITPLDLARLFSTSPCRILRIEGGRISAGLPANLTLINPSKPFVINPDRFISKGKNTPFKDWKVPGGVAMTIVEGKIVWKDEGERKGGAK